MHRRTVFPVTMTAAMTLANAAMAQDVCGGAGAGGQWIGGSESNSDISVAEAYHEQMALVLGGNQYVSLFSVSEPGAIRIEAQGRGAGDPVIDLLDASGTIIASDDDSGGEGASRAEVDLEPGTYCMALSSYDGTPMTAFVRIGRTDQEPLTLGTGQDNMVQTEGGETPSPPDAPPAADASCADAVHLGSVTAEGLSGSASADDAPYLTFDLTESMAITITAANEAADPLITLYDAEELYLAENDDYAGLNSQIDMPDPLAAGRYCLAVSALADSTLPIDLNITRFDPQAALEDLYASGDAAPPMDGPIPITDLGSIGGRLRHDATIGGTASWFSLSLDQAGLLLMEAIDATGNGDPWVVVYDDLGRQIAMNDDYGEGYDSLIAARVPAGTYLIGVKQVEQDFSGLTRMVFERYIAAP